MLSKEQIAHELAMVFINNKYGVSVSGKFSIISGTGDGKVESGHMPSTKTHKMIQVGTGEKGIFGKEKTKPVGSGFEVDELFVEITEEYYQAYSKFFQLLTEKESISKN